MGRGLNKATRLKEIERLLVQHRGGYTANELSARFDVDRTTTWRDLQELETTVPLIEVEPGRFAIDRMHYPALIRLSPAEALMVYLAVRRLARHTRFAQQMVTDALEKIAQSLHQPMTERVVEAAAHIADQETPAQQRAKTINTIVEAWIEGRKVRIEHCKLHGNEVRSYIVSPYLIEPSLWGEGAYLIGHSDYHQGLATFKLERIERASPTSDSFDVPDDLNADTLLQHAWGIWYGEGEPVMVRLRFTEWVTQRVQETKWHPKQKITLLPDGGCEWSAEVAEWREMVPWVRGWGADCEALVPPELREALVRDAKRMAALYGVGTSSTAPAFRLLWAKTKRRTGEVHLLLYHLIDVGKVALALWREVLTEQTRLRLARSLGLSIEQAGRFIAFLVGLHDLGKASPSFQRKYAPHVPVLEQAGLAFGRPSKAAPHGMVSAWALKPLLTDAFNLDGKVADRLARIVGGHHGTWPTGRDVSHLGYDDKGDQSWETARAALFSTLKEVFQPPQITFPDLSRADLQAFLTIFSGFTTVADWVGSNEQYFPYVDQIRDALHYAAQAETQAYGALRSLGWMGWQPTGDTAVFEHMFPDLSPRPAQQTVIDIEHSLKPPGLLIVEAPTGVGKTELALYLADHWAQRSAQQGLYIAMPTMATSNQMFDRVTQFLERRYPADLINVPLVHSQAKLDDRFKVIRLAEISTDDGDRDAGRIAAMSWFLPRKRTLLAPFGVGTVDQALMSVLQTKHFFVRLFGLSNKTVIFDEVHAYDTYMSALFQRLLTWLSAIGTSVIVLSATLPAQTRRDLIEAYAGKPVDLDGAVYPCATWVGAGGDTRVVNFPAPETREINLAWIDKTAVVEQLETTLAGGGCTAVICNTIDRAQEVYRTLKTAGLVDDENLILFHARYPATWRREIEARVLNCFGRKGDRPHKAIVVATQVIEQSLDLDFDLMVTDPAPIDLVLQRAGRLHRHDRERPSALSKPQLLITMPALQDGIPDFGNDAWVYEAYILLRSYLALHDKTRLVLPAETVDLIEAVYSAEQAEVPEVWRAALAQAEQDMKATQDKARREALQRLVPNPNDYMLLSRPPVGLEEDNPDVHAALQAMTRLIRPGVSLVCLHRVGDRVFLEPDGSGPVIDTEATPNITIVEQMLQHSVTVQNWAVREHFLEREPPDAWSNQAALRHCRPAIFEGGIYRINSRYHLKLTHEFGLEIVKET